LAALDEVNVVAENAEPEGEVSIGDLIERVSRDAVS
jgi:hypothetical protein